MQFDRRSLPETRRRRAHCGRVILHLGIREQKSRLLFSIASALNASSSVRLDGWHQRFIITNKRKNVRSCKKNYQQQQKWPALRLSACFECHNCTNWLCSLRTSSLDREPSRVPRVARAACNQFESSNVCNRRLLTFSRCCSRCL